MSNEYNNIKAIIMQDPDTKKAINSIIKDAVNDAIKEIKKAHRQELTNIILELKQTQEEELLTQKEVMEILKIGRATLLKWRHEGLIKEVPKARKNSYPRFRKSEVLALAQH